MRYLCYRALTRHYTCNGLLIYQHCTEGSGLLTTAMNYYTVSTFRNATVQTRVPSTPPNLKVGYVLTQSTSSNLTGPTVTASASSTRLRLGNAADPSIGL